MGNQAGVCAASHAADSETTIVCIVISDAVLSAGLARLERDLPLDCVSRNYVMVARK